MNKKLVTHMQAPGPKKILTLDDGDIRGMIAVEVLSRWRCWQKSKPCCSINWVAARILCWPIISIKL